MFKRWQRQERKNSGGTLSQRPNLVATALKAKISALTIERFIETLRQS